MLAILTTAPPYDPWRDPIWQFIGVIVAILLGVVGLIVAIRANRQQNRRKELTYQIEVDTPVVSVDKTLKNAVEIRYHGSVVEDVRLVLIKIWNSGTLAVKREDYEEPIKFELPGRTRLSYRVESDPEEVTKAKNPDDFLKFEPDCVKLSPFLLNPTDSVTLNMLVSGQGKIKGAARIIDGKLIEFDPGKQDETLRNLQSIIGGIYILSLLVFIPLVFFHVQIIATIFIPLTIASIFAFYGIIFLRMIATERHKRRIRR
jgi:hypothetical protein